MINNLVKNGSFEQYENPTFDNSTFLAVEKLPNWELRTGNAYELTRNNYTDVKDGEFALDMAATPSNLDIVQYVENVQSGNRYQLEFYANFNGVGGQPDGTAKLEVIWGGQKIATLTSDQVGLQQYKFDIVGNSGDGTNSLEFKEIGEVDNYGTYIDKVSIVHSNETPNQNENTITGTPQQDVLNGTSGKDIIYGLQKSDTIDGGAGNDTIYGGTGNDSISGGDGYDSINGDDGNDYINGGSGNDVINSGIGFDSIYGAAGSDIIDGGAGNDYVNAGSGNDVVNGSDGNDTIYAGLGDDSIYGGAGQDSINGDDGNDYISGGSSNDIVRAGLGNDTVYGDAGSDIIDGDAGNDYVNSGSGNDTVYGDEGNDTILGGAGNDKIEAGQGQDKIYAGTGKNLVSGGADSDTFVFNANDSVTTGGNWTTISDFTVNSDKINLANLNDLFTSITTAATTVAGELKVAYDAVINSTYLTSDQNDFAIELANGNFVNTLDNNDFIF